MLDVRSPSEFAAARVPGAVSFPLFTDAERAAVGTTYKQKGNQLAVLQGLDFIGPRLGEMARQALQLSPSGTVGVYCWRGGMRSASVAWLLETVGLKVLRLEGGYKAYRHWALAQLETPLNVYVLGGPTGSGKTLALKELAQRGHQVLDLEALARHQGSAFGAIGQAPQPTQEDFENQLAECIAALNPALPVWVEDESRKIGRLVLPQPFWNQLSSAPIYVLQVPMATREAYLVETYGQFPREDLAASLLRIEKRLGGQATREALRYLDEGRLADVARLALVYYDKTYAHSLSLRPPHLHHRVPCAATHPQALADAVENALASASSSS